LVVVSGTLLKQIRIFIFTNLFSYYYLKLKAIVLNPLSPQIMMNQITCETYGLKIKGTNI